MVFQLTQKLVFPDPHYGEPDGLLAVGGDLSVDRLLLAYSNGIFPWYAFREKQIQWWCPPVSYTHLDVYKRQGKVTGMKEISYKSPAPVPDKWV